MTGILPRYSLVVFQRPPFVSWPLFVQRLVHLNVGLMFYGLSVALMVWGAIGLGPWDVFHQGLSLVTPLSFGQAMIGAGLAVLLLSVIFTHTKVGIGTVANMVLIGVWADVFLAVPSGPHGGSWWVGLAIFMAGALLSGLATGLYITAGLGAGPRDGFALGIAKVTGISVRLSRTIIEITAIGSGWLMGGAVGVGTVLFALTAGPFMQFFLRICLPLQKRYERAEAAAKEANNAIGRQPTD